MMRRRNGEPTGNGHHHNNNHSGADGFGPDAALLGFHGGSGAYSSPSRTATRSDDGFSSVSGGPLHLGSTGSAHHQQHQPNKLYVSSPAPAGEAGLGLSGSGYRGGGGPASPAVEDYLGDRTPLFGSPPGTAAAAAGFDARFGRGASVSALRSARARDRRRLLGRLAVRATQPAALLVLAGLVLVTMMISTSTSWSGQGDLATAASAPAATSTLATTAAASGGAAELLAETAVEVLSQAAALGSTSAGGSHGNIKVVQPDNLGSAAAAVNVDSPVKGEAGVLWLLDEDGNKKVVLVPRDAEKKQATAAAAASTQVASKLQQKQSLLQKLGLTKKKDHKKQKQQQQAKQQAAETSPAAASAATTTTDASAASDVVTYYYDSVVPRTAMASTGGAASSTGTGPGQEAPLTATSSAAAVVPEVVYDKMGNAVKLVDLHNVGATEKTSGVVVSNPVLGNTADDAINAVADALPSNAAAAAKVPKTQPAAQAVEISGATAARTVTSLGSAGASSLEAEAEGTTNQLIVVATVATMALFGGALVARRMRTRNFLNSCIENESLEDEAAYDAAHTTLGAAVGYDTFSAVGDMKWKGDLEKFDV